ncbi:hypothetical protein [Cupriavidus numazuensis]|uniref:Uncharacterized protein n=1 Tax=Cupriavidus numazuensis TaxID=221992 RepID=A0ABM8TAY2_9BURK|nr:hypothetical protein [Cupriavidus numazuensis]CAG2132545.1 hypothetical protein LMG26411_00636 [Cupriavidus numazuensis]
MKIIHQGNPRAKRKAEYPDIGDQLDAIWKAFAAMDPADVPEPARAMLEQVRAVKVKYPVRPAG